VAPGGGRGVSADHGCGAHSAAMANAVAARAVAPVIDEFGYDFVELPGVSVGETVFDALPRGADCSLRPPAAAARARPRFSLGTYHSPNRPNATPHAQVQIHQRWPGGRLPWTISRTTS